MITRLKHIILLLVCLAWPVAAQQSAQESTEPPVPRAAPLKPIVEETLPRAGGVLVFGGSRGVGLEAVTELTRRGEKITAMVRKSSDRAALEALGVNLVTGDALDSEDLKRAFAAAPFRVVVSTIGGHGKNLRPDFEGNRNIVDAAKAAGIPRMVLVTAIGAGDSEDAAPWYFKLFLKDFMAEKTKAENYLRRSGLEYTIIRPGWLLDRAASGKATFIDDRANFSWIARAELGRLIADTLKNGAMVNKIVTAFDSSLDRFWKLAF